MDASRVEIMYRPVRVGWVLHSEDREAMRLAMRMSFCLVGGIYNPLILVDQPEAEALVRLFRLDVLEVVGSHPMTKAFAARFPHLGQIGQGPLFKTSARGVFSTCQLLDVANGVRVWSEWSNWNDCTGDESGIKLIRWAADDVLADVHLAGRVGCRVVDHDRYGRSVARCWSDATPDINAALTRRALRGEAFSLLRAMSRTSPGWTGKRPAFAAGAWAVS